MIFVLNTAGIVVAGLREEGLREQQAAKASQNEIFFERFHGAALVMSLLRRIVWIHHVEFQEVLFDRRLHHQPVTSRCSRAKGKGHFARGQNDPGRRDWSGRRRAALLPLIPARSLGNSSVMGTV